MTWWAPGESVTSASDQAADKITFPEIRSRHVGVLRPYFIINTSHSPHGKYADGLESWKGEHTICHPICWLFCLITASSRLCQAHFSREASDSSSGFTPQTIGQQMPLTHCAAPAPDITTHLNIIIGPIQSKYLHAPQEEYFREHSLVFFTRSAVKL